MVDDIFIKITSPQPPTLLKQVPTQVFSGEFLRNFCEHLLYKKTISPDKVGDLILLVFKTILILFPLRNFVQSIQKHLIKSYKIFTKSLLVFGIFFV